MPAWLQQWIRVLLYSGFGGLASHGLAVSGSTKEIVISVVGYLATAAWTMYGTRLNGLAEMIKEKTGVVGVELKVDPDLIKPNDVTQNTSAGISAKPA